MRRATIVFVFALSILTVRASYFCRSSFEDISSEASELSSAADDAADARKKLDRAKEEYENCLRFPDTFDIYDDDCQTLRDEYNRAVRKYNNAVGEVQAAYEGVVHAVESVQTACK